MSGAPTSPPEAGRLTLPAAAALTLACVLWAASSIASKAALGDAGQPDAGRIGPLALACVRFGVGGILLLALVRCRGPLPTVHRGDRRALVYLGAGGIALTYAIFYAGQRYTSATEATLLIAAEPLLIAALARVFLGERLRVAQNLGLLTGFVGVYLIVVQGLAPSFSVAVLANAALASALVFEASASIVGKRLTAVYPGLYVAAVGMLVGAGVLLPFAVFEVIRVRAFAPSPSAWLGLGYLTFVCSGLCYGIWYLLLPRYRVSAMAAFLFIQPMLGPFLGWGMLGDHVSGWTNGGASLIVLGVWIVAGSDRGTLPRSGSY